jgi:hypothetical protein
MGSVERSYELFWVKLKVRWVISGEHIGATWAHYMRTWWGVVFLTVDTHLYPFATKKTRLK